MRQGWPDQAPQPVRKESVWRCPIKDRRAAGSPGEGLLGFLASDSIERGRVVAICHSQADIFRILDLAQAVLGDEEAIVAAPGTSEKTIARARKRVVTEGIAATSPTGYRRRIGTQFA